MSAIPMILPKGMILVYGWGYYPAMNGITPDNTIFKFGSVYQIWAGGEQSIYFNDEVMWKDGDEYCKLAYAGNPYTQIPARLATKIEPVV